MVPYHSLVSLRVIIMKSFLSPFKKFIRRLKCSKSVDVLESVDVAEPEPGAVPVDETITVMAEPMAVVDAGIVVLGGGLDCKKEASTSGCWGEYVIATLEELKGRYPNATVQDATIVAKERMSEMSFVLEALKKDMPAKHVATEEVPVANTLTRVASVAFLVTTMMAIVLSGALPK